MNRPVHFRHVSKLPERPSNVVGKMTLPSAEEAAKADAELLARKAKVEAERKAALDRKPAKPDCSVGQ